MSAGNDLAQLQGSWNLLTLELDGVFTPPSSFAGAQIIIQGESFTTTAMGATYDGAILLGSSEQHKTIDLIFVNGPEKGNRSRGIYQLDGDAWTLCLTVNGAERPTAFATAPGSGLALESLYRRPSGSITETGTRECFPPTPELEGEWEMITCTLSGQSLPASYIQHGRRVAKGNETTVTANGQLLLSARYRVHRSTEPAFIDYELTSGPHEGKHQYGIWKLEDDIFTTCFAAPGADRPDNFVSSRGDGNTLTAWRRILAL